MHRWLQNFWPVPGAGVWRNPSVALPDSSSVLDRFQSAIERGVGNTICNPLPWGKSTITLAHQNRTIAIASDFRVDGAKSPEIPQKEGVLGSEIAARNRKSLANLNRTLQSQCSIAFSCLRLISVISAVRDGYRNHQSQKSLAISNALRR